MHYPRSASVLGFTAKRAERNANVLIRISEASAGRKPVLGFTLIELLVVIAIIGILSAVIVASLNLAHSKGNFGAIQADMHTVQNQAEIYYSDHGNSYGAPAATSTAGSTACLTSGIFSDPNVSGAINSIRGASATSIQCGIGCSGGCYDVIVQSPAGSWCVNQEGVATSSAC